MKMEKIRARMSAIEDPRHQRYVKYPLADILIIIMCSVLCGLDTLGDVVIYAKSSFFEKHLKEKRNAAGQNPHADFCFCLPTLLNSTPLKIFGLG